MILNPDRTVTLQTEDCFCRDGTMLGIKSCDACMGTGRTKKGKGKGNCRQCDGCKTVLDSKNKVPCNLCNGTKIVPETKLSIVPKEWIDALPVVVYRSNRPTTFRERCIGAGLLSVVDYGKHDAQTDRQLEEMVKNSFHFIQLTLMLNNGRFADSLAILCSQDGYSLFPVFQNNLTPTPTT